MKPFDLERAKAGDPICTLGGQIVKFICHVPEVKVFNVIVLVDKYLIIYREDGTLSDDYDMILHLFMAPIKSEAWINVYRDNATGYAFAGNSHPSEKQAKDNIREDSNYHTYIHTIKIYSEEI